MKLRGYPVMTLMVATVFGMAGLFAGLAGAQPVPALKAPRPAAAGSSPEETLLKQLPPSAKPEALRPTTQAELENACKQNPRCRAKLEQAKQGKRPAQPLPAAIEPSPEEKLQKSLPPPAQGLPPVGPRSHIPGPVEQIFSWINPLTPDQAWAQTALNLTFTPANRFNQSPYGWVGLYGGSIRSNNIDYTLNNSSSTSQNYVENKPFVYLSVNLPVAGYYAIDVVASKSFVKLRHQSNGPILETWDYRGGCGSALVCHYVTVDYYEAGAQYWYFWADAAVPNTYFYSVTIKSYP